MRRRHVDRIVRPSRYDRFRVASAPIRARARADARFARNELAAVGSARAGISIAVGLFMMAQGSLPKWLSFVAFGAAMALPACSSKLKVEEAESMLLKGTAGGIELGDSWDSIKQAHDARFKLREDHSDPRWSIFQLRKDLGPDQGYGDHFYVQVTLDEQSRVKVIEVRLQGDGEGSRLSVQTIEDALIAYLIAKLRLHNRSCVTPGSRSCLWDFEQSGKQYEVRTHAQEFDNHDTSQFDCTIAPRHP